MFEGMIHKLYGGINIIENPHIPKNMGIWIDEHTLAVKHVTYFYDHPRELFRIYDFEMAVKKYCEYVLDNLYTKIEKTFKNFSPTDKEK